MTPAWRLRLSALLVTHEAPTGRTTHYVYDASARCTETWVDYPGGTDESLDRDVPSMLADGVTKARGVLHVKIDAQGEYVEVDDSRSVRGTSATRSASSTRLSSAVP